MDGLSDDTSLMNGSANPLSDYQACGQVADLYGGASPPVAEKWNELAQRLSAVSGGNPAQLHDQIAREIQNLGLTFRLTGDEDERAWPLNPMPLLIGATEWSKIDAGLIQRANLLERVIADIYGSQQLIAEGLLPASLVSGSRHFTRKMIGSKPPGGHFLHVIAVDLARGPTGEWRVLSDRLRFSTGIGYALENRLALMRSVGGSLAQVGARRLASFFGKLREGIAANCRREEPTIALLSPGRFNQSYPEQAHLARYLGFPLVEGRDLTVNNGQLLIRTIAGPKEVDGIWRWIDTQAIDPLSFDAQSQIGVPDLFAAWSKGDLVAANWPGAGVVEAHAFSAFMPRLATRLLGGPLLLPNVATWWCGQEKEARIVRERLSELVVSSAFGGEVIGLAKGRTRMGDSFSAEEREELLNAMDRRPMDYCGQEIVQRSSTPTLIESEFLPRPFTLRAFIARDGNGDWTVMPGGFARLSSSGDLRTSLMGKGDLSADVCIIDDDPGRYQTAPSSLPITAIRRKGGILSSQAADNLFWFSRYIERAEMTVRIIKSLLGSSIEADGGATLDLATQNRLIQLLVQWGAIKPDQAALIPIEICNITLGDHRRSGSVPTLLANSRHVLSALRDRIANDFWRIVNRPPAAFTPGNPDSMLGACINLIERFSAHTGFVAENIVRGPTWRFLMIGRRVERANNICRVAETLGQDGNGPDDMGVLLDLFDSQIVYRARYMIAPTRDAVLDLILLDPENPRSLIFQIQELVEDLATLPVLRDNGLPEQPLRQAHVILTELYSLEIAALAPGRLQHIATLLIELSESISQRYFLQIEKPDEGPEDELLL